MSTRDGITFTLGLLLAMACSTALGQTGTATVEENVSQGVALFEERRYGEAEKKFRAALETDPSSRSAKANLAKLRATQGHLALREGSLSVAQDHLEEAVELLPGDIPYRLLLGIILYRQNDLYYARYTVEKALELDPAHGRARELLGDILYQEGILDGALEQWEKTGGGAPIQHSLERKIARAERELKLEEGFGSEVSRNFTVRYDGPVPKAVILSVLSQLEAAHRTLERELGISPPGDILVILYSRVNFQEVTKRPKWVGGTFDGKIRIPVGGLSTEERALGLDPILHHELTHAFLRSMVGRRLPIWFEEGLAEHFERSVRGGHPDPMHGREREPGIAGFDELAAAFRGEEKLIEEAYATSASAVAWLTGEKGFPAVRGVLEEVEAGMTFPQALEEAAGLSLQEFQDRFFD
jgi:tetratricopeptide (TPR) repeat protein